MLFALISNPAQGKTIPPVIESEERGAPVGGMFEVFDDIGLEEKMPAVAFNSTLNQYLVVWYNDRPGNDDIRGQRLNANGSPLGASFYISAGVGNERRYPDVAYNVVDNQYLVVWEDYDNLDPGTPYSIRGRRISSTGTLMDINDIIIRAKSPNYMPMSPRVDYAFTSNKYLVVWSEWSFSPLQRDIVGQVLEPDGLLNGTSFIISDDTGGDFREHPDLAYNRHANRYLVVWQQYDDSASLWDIFGQQVHGGGGLYSSPIVIGYHTIDETIPRVASIPTTPINSKFLVVWEAHYAPGDYDIYLRPIEEEGDLGTVQLFAVTNDNECNPNVIGSESSMKYLVTWEKYRIEDYGSGTVSGYGTVGQEILYDGTSSGSIKMIGRVTSTQAALAEGSAGDFLAVFMQVDITYGIWGQFWGLRTYLPMIIR